MKAIEEIGIESIKDNVFSNLTDLFLKKHISETDSLLLKYSFSQKPTQEEFENLLQKINKEPQRERKLLMISYLQKLNSELDYKNFETIEFKNILRSYRLEEIIIDAAAELIKYLRPFSFQINEFTVIIRYVNYLRRRI